MTTPEQRLKDAIDQVTEEANAAGQMVLVIRAGKDPEDVGYSVGGRGGIKGYIALGRAIHWTVGRLAMKVSVERIQSILPDGFKIVREGDS